MRIRICAKGATADLLEVLRVRQDVEVAMEALRADCGLSEAVNMKQCLRVLLHRLSSNPQVAAISIEEFDGVSTILSSIPVSGKKEYLKYFSNCYVINTILKKNCEKMYREESLLNVV
jgi:hypothetical protein